MSVSQVSRNVSHKRVWRDAITQRVRRRKTDPCKCVCAFDGGNWALTISGWTAQEACFTCARTNFKKTAAGTLNGTYTLEPHPDYPCTWRVILPTQLALWQAFWEDTCDTPIDGDPAYYILDCEIWLQVADCNATVIVNIVGTSNYGTMFAGGGTVHGRTVAGSNSITDVCGESHFHFGTGGMFTATYTG